MNSACTYRAMQAADGPAIAAALGIAEEQWRWLFEANPSGSDGMLALDADGRVMAHCAGVGRRSMLGGKERRIAEIVFPFEQASGLLALSAKGYLAEFGGPRASVVCYGWPSEARLWTRMLGFEVVCTESLLVHEQGLLAKPTDDGLRVEVLTRFDEQARWLYDRCAGDLGLSSIRDADALNWRFMDRPEYDYHVLGARDGEGILRGFAVLAAAPGRDAMRVHSEEPWPGRPLIVDWLVPVDEPEVGRRLLAEALEWTRARTDAPLATSVPSWSPWFALFQAAGFRVHFDPRALIATGFVRKYDDLWLRDHAWLTLADWSAV